MAAFVGEERVDLGKEGVLARAEKRRLRRSKEDNGSEEEMMGAAHGTNVLAVWFIRRFHWSRALSIFRRRSGCSLERSRI